MWLQENYLTRGFWGDEAWTALISRLPIGSILQVTGQDFHPPLYYLLVHVFMQIFGESEWIRAISTFFFLLALIPTYALAKKVSGSRVVARTTTGLMALSPIMLTYAFEARAYALLTFLSVYSSLLFWNALAETKGKSKKSSGGAKPWIGYALVAGLGVYTHYYMWFILASHGLYWLVMNRKQFKRVFFTYLSVVLVQLPWIPVLFSQLKSVKGSYWIGQINERTHWEFFMRVVAGDFSTDWQGYWALAVLFTMIVGGVFVWLRNKHSLPKGYVFLWFWLVIPILFPTVLSFVYKPVFFYRYLVFSIVPILMLTTWGLTAMGKRMVVPGVVAMVVLSAVTDRLILMRSPYGFRQELANKVFNAPVPPSETVKVYTYLPSFAEVYYYVDQRVPVVVIPEGLVQFSGQSLLDKYVELGLVTIENPPTNVPYWEVGPEKTSQFHEATK